MAIRARDDCQHGLAIRSEGFEGRTVIQPRIRHQKERQPRPSIGQRESPQKLAQSGKDLPVLKLEGWSARSGSSSYSADKSGSVALRFAVRPNYDRA